MRTVINLSALLFAATAQAQCGPVINVVNDVQDGVYMTEHVPTRRLIPYEFVRESDVTWSKRVWRSIDLREKINHPLYYPMDEYDSDGRWVLNNSRWSLWSILKANVMCGNLTLFSPYNPYQFSLTDGDQFKYAVFPADGKNYYSDSVFRATAFSYLGKLGPQSTTVLVTDSGIDSTRLLPDGTMEYVYPPRDTNWFMSKDIVQYHIKEDWFFDKERSMMDSRILGICPVMYDKDNSGQIVGLRELFWIYFPHCRYVLNNYNVYNEQTDAQAMSFDDLFWKRQFSSTIYKESNVFDRNIDAYRTGTDALIESDRITEEIRQFDHDVWNY